MPGKSGRQDAPVIIKKYANRRLYNTATSSYVTLDDLATMVKADKEFVVYDAKSGEEITRSVLTQIIVEEESKGQHLLPIGFLRQLISYYGDSLQAIVPKYLEQSMESFATNHEEMRQYLSNAMEGMFPFGSIEDLSRQNMAFLQQAMKMLTPFPVNGDKTDPPGKDAGTAGGADEARRPPPAKDAPKEADADAFAELNRKIELLQQQLEKLSENKS